MNKMLICIALLTSVSAFATDNKDAMNASSAGTLLIPLSIPMTTTQAAAHLSGRDQRIILDSKEDAIRFVANGEGRTARLTQAFNALRSSMASTAAVSDLALAEYIVTNF